MSSLADRPHSTPIATPTLSVRTRERRAVLVAALLGFSLVFVAGFADLAAIHDAAHDGRHSLAFPCH